MTTPTYNPDMPPAPPFWTFDGCEYDSCPCVEASHFPGWYFYQSGGKLRGPFETEELATFIQEETENPNEN